MGRRGTICYSAKVVRRWQQRGFTLIEIAIAMVIVSVVLSGMLALLFSQLENSRISSSHDKQRAIEQSIVNFLLRNNRVPCPAVATNASGSAGYGVEAATPGTCTGATQVGSGGSTSSRGVVPWVTLGISDEQALDGWGHRFTYQVIRSQTNLSAPTVSGLTGFMALFDRAGGNQINPGNEAVVMLVSHGKNGRGAYLPATGSRLTVPPSASSDERENSDNDNNFVQKDYSTNTTNPFDDIVAALSPAQLLARMVDSGVTASPYGVVNERFSELYHALLSYMASHANRSLPSADCSSTPDGNSTAGCLSGTVPWVDLGVSQQVATNPWGGQLTYSVDGTMASSGLTQTVPSGTNTALTLTASGSDAVFSTSDDISEVFSVSQLRGALIGASVTLPP
ncbi:MAG: prepilin-type N-terminal cleavage/methylation domain-containing protein [Gammaproteobacteria bacterium]|nr:prepilin-type N-terminal cleavage/methylation domain-containing protein [Gammaproteobacteria bacterium]